MPVADYRGHPFSIARLDVCGKDIGKKVFWKLYAIENLVRVIVSSVLSAQIGPGWWTIAVDANIQREVARFQAQYQASPWHSSPGTHELYFTHLRHLNEIMRANRNLFVVPIPTIDQWIGRIEQIRLPRNVVGHMNWLTAADRQRIDVFYADMLALAQSLFPAQLAPVIP